MNDKRTVKCFIQQTNGKTSLYIQEETGYYGKQEISKKTALIYLLQGIREQGKMLKTTNQRIHPTWF